MGLACCHRMLPDRPPIHIRRIHSATAPLDPDLIAGVENELREQYELEGAPPPRFPERYPTAALLGCANCVGVLHKAQLAQLSEIGKLPKLLPRENGSTYIFCIDGARALPLPVQMTGQHKVSQRGGFELDTPDRPPPTSQLWPLTHARMYSAALENVTPRFGPNRVDWPAVLPPCDFGEWPILLLVCDPFVHDDKTLPSRALSVTDGG